MKNIDLIRYLAIATLAAVISCNATLDNKKENPKMNNDVVIEGGYDSLKAKKYGADDYGMKKYVMAFLKKGSNRDLEKEEAAKLQTAHLKNIGRMAEEGTLVLAGPFFGDGDLRGIYIFDVSSIEEAEKLTNTDPAIKAGSLVMELKEWYGSAGLKAINDIHKTLAKKAEM